MSVSPTRGCHTPELSLPPSSRTLCQERNAILCDLYGHVLTRIRFLATLVTNLLTNCCLVDLIDMTLACEDANSKLVDVVTFADVDAEDNVGNSLLQIWKLRFGHKAKLLFKLSAQGLVRSSKLKFRRVWSVCHC